MYLAYEYIQGTYGAETATCVHLLFVLRVRTQSWIHIHSNLPTLVKLIIEEQYSTSAVLDEDNLNLAPFLNVTTLRFVVKTATDLIEVMQRSEFPSLNSFCMIVDILLWEEVEQLFRALSRCKACQTLEEIEITCRVPAAAASRSLTVLAVRQLSCFTQLRKLRLSVPLSIYLDNDLFLKAMSSWPHIEALELDDPYPGLPAITFRGLFTALRLCPRLHTLRISVDAVNIDIDPTTESYRHPSPSCQFDVDSSPVKDAKAVAFIVFSMLPGVRMISHRRPRNIHRFGAKSTGTSNYCIVALVSQTQLSSSDPQGFRVAYFGHLCFRYGSIQAPVIIGKVDEFHGIPPHVFQILLSLIWIVSPSYIS
ncbi:hypothetical protein AZE42_06781 [Rhizopogon vesiculosus]|uniref:F-box domain-containing protein n=2 Tax=Rhizopogon vesiculosus TaxID=180088 RepID=A0A1J8R1S4_9AGAM|nr:hypothetical protein AZE42_06781 [Rhizopogon vesiculosus]